MSIDDKQEYVAAEAAAPRWVGIVVIALAIVSLAALGTGWSAVSEAAIFRQLFRFVLNLSVIAVPERVARQHFFSFQQIRGRTLGKL